MKILHTSDWHLGRYFHNVSLLDDQRFALQHILQLLAGEKIDVLLVSGDLYDRSVPPVQAVDMLDDFLDQVCNKLKIDTVIIPGNHDSAARLHFGSRHMLESRLHILADLNAVSKPVEIKRGDHSALIYGVPYIDTHTVNSEFSQEFANCAEALEFMLNKLEIDEKDPRPKILLSHCFVSGGAESESERPLSVGGSEQVPAQLFSGFDYVALGHLHKPQTRLAEHIRYSGSLLKYSFSEHNHQKSVVVLDVKLDEEITLKTVPVEAKRDVRVLSGKLSELLEQGKSDSASEDYILAQLTDTQALLDPIGQLRKVYPNTLHIERQVLANKPIAGSSTHVLKRKAEEMFADFFDQLTGEPLNDEQESYLKTVIEQAQNQSDDH